MGEADLLHFRLRNGLTGTRGAMAQAGMSEQQRETARYCPWESSEIDRLETCCTLSPV